MNAVQQLAYDAYLQLGALFVLAASGWVVAYVLWRYVRQIHSEVLKALKDNTEALTKIAERVK